jgi:iron uptake system EfeUOB component EfeO/EfeM
VHGRQLSGAAKESLHCARNIQQSQSNKSINRRTIEPSNQQVNEPATDKLQANEEHRKTTWPLLAGEMRFQMVELEVRFNGPGVRLSMRRV